MMRHGYDLAGRVVKETNALDGVTISTYFYDSQGQLITTNTYADGGQRIETHYMDGSLKKLDGSASFPVRYEYGVGQDGGVYRLFAKEIKLNSDGSDSSESVTNFVDAAGRAYKTVFAGAGSPYRQSTFNDVGQLVKERDPDGVVTLFQYNATGELAYTAIDSNRNDVIDFSGLDRIKQTTNDVVASHSTNVLRTRTYIWEANGSDTATLLSSVEISVEGLTTWQTNVGLGSSSVKSLPSGAAYTVIQTAPDASYAVSLFQTGRVASVTGYDSYGVQIGKTTFGYDAHGRQSSTTDARNGATTLAFNNADLAASVTTPAPGTGLPAQTTTTYFDTMLRATNIVHPDGTVLANVYSPRGELVRSSGSRTYPVGYAYDPQGRLKHMTNWTTFPSTGARVTTWHYDAERGWLTNKLYPDSLGTKYSYTAAGRLNTRLWARGTNTSYSYNNFGDLASLDYSDATADLAYTYNRRGRQENVTQGANTWKLFYTVDGQLLSEAGTGGLLSGLRVTNAFDAFLRRTNVATLNGGSALTTHGYAYDAASRLASVNDGTYSAAYSFLTNSPIVSQITFKSNATVRLTTTKQYDKLNRLLNINSLPSASGSAFFASTYLHNDANQRVRNDKADGSAWSYDYDPLGEVTQAKRRWNDGVLVAGQQFEYTYDDIGNRKTAKEGADDSGQGFRSSTYSANALNEYTNRTVAGAADIMGVAHASATVNVNGASAYRKCEYFRKEISVTNTSTAVWQSISNYATLGGTNQTNFGFLFVPKTPEVPAYDSDGNLTTNGQWFFTWDAENRLTKAESLSGNPTASKRKVEFTYDGQGRRVRRIESDGGSGSYLVSRDEKSLHNGWMCLAELNATNDSVVRTYLWGLDLSGTMTGAGGVGGLLAISSTAGGMHFAAYDGNGNVESLVNAADGTVSALYEYGPFGQTLRATGPMALENPWRFSTKRADDALDLVLYEYRAYSPTWGRWLNRDPIGEVDSPAILSSLHNCPPNTVDSFGLQVVDQGVVVIRPVEPDDGFDTAEGSLNSHINNFKDKKKWIVIDVENIQDANEKMKKAPCKCIKELNITGHGNKGLQGIVGTRDPQKAKPGYGRLEAVLDPKTKTYSFRGLQMFTGVKFCKPCTIILRGCNAGEGPAGKALLKAIANATGCKVQAWEQPTTEITPYKGLPGGGTIQFGPDITVEPDNEKKK